MWKKVSRWGPLVMAISLLAAPGQANASGRANPRLGIPPQQTLQDTSGARQDTTSVAEPGGAKQDSIVIGGWTSLESDGTITTIRGSPEQPAWVRVEDLEVRAGIIVYDQENDVITALPMPDTSATEEGQMLHMPVFRQGDQDLVGSQMYYDLSTEKGKVYGGRTTYEFGYYHGSVINAFREDPNYLTVRAAKFTTCDLDDPHYFFSSEKMKIIPDDKVIAKGIRFNLLGIQIPPRLFTIPGINLDVFPALPFIIKSIRTGRQSGLLMPQYSDNSLTGFTLKDLGYYWAPSDYFDARVVADVTEKVGMIVRARTRYNWRYRLSGNIESTYNHDRRAGTRRWELRFNHNQTLSPSMRLTARGNFSSTSDFNKQLSDDLARRLQRVLRSHANFSKRFGNGTNLTVTLSQNRFLDREITDTQLPTATFRVPRRPLFGAGGRSSDEGGPGGLTGFGLTSGSEEESAIPKWYENLYFDYNVNLRSSIRNQVYDSGTPAERDSTTQQIGVQQKTNLTYSGKAMGWLNVQPSFSAQEDWYYGDTALNDFQKRTLWNASLRASTKLYGMADRPFGMNVVFRHVVEPSLSLTYSPDFTDIGQVPTLFGSNPGPQQRLSFSLTQLFQMKRWVEEQERKTDLVRITSSGSYNKQAATRKLSDINTSLVSNIGRTLSLQVNARHSFYARDEAGEYQFQRKPILMTASYRSSFRLDSATLATWLGIGREAGETPEEELAEEEAAQQPPVEAGEQEEAPFGVPTRDAGRLVSPGIERARESGIRWNLSLGHYYSWTKGRDTPVHSLDGSLSFNLPKWTFSVSARYDFEALTGKKLVRQSFNIYRNLHCWEARLQLVPTGPGKGYWFVIAIKDIPEIKYEQRKTVY